MSDNFEFTLHSPLTKEDWNKLSDAELENTMSVTFQTPQGRQVKYIKCEVLDKIRAEIVELIDWHDCTIELDCGNDLWFCEACNRAFEIIDKYKAESEVQDADSD